MRWTVLEDVEAVARAAVDRITQAAADAIAAKDSFCIVLAGGGTPRRTYELLAQSEQQWRYWHIYFGDERCLPLNHPERNSVMAARALTSRVPIPPQQIYPIPAELGPEVAAAAYARKIAAALPFDLVLLGLGEDGHTASLFSGRSYRGDRTVVAVRDAPKPPPERVSLSAAALSNSKRLLFLVTGGNKGRAVKRWRSGDDLPVANISSTGDSEVVLDRTAVDDPLLFL